MTTFQTHRTNDAEPSDVAAYGVKFFVPGIVMAITREAERVQSPMEVELWASPLYFLLMLGVVTAEWVLRKMSHLK